MCNFILLSCDSGIDLKEFESGLLEFKRLNEQALALNPDAKYLSYEHMWLLTSKITFGCSCGFRHGISADQEYGRGFSEPEDWYQEKEEHIEATKEFYRLIKQLLGKGIKVDSFDFFDNNTGLTPLSARMEIHIDQVQENAFMFFEQVLFDYK